MIGDFRVESLFMLSETKLFFCFEDNLILKTTNCSVIIKPTPNECFANFFTLKIATLKAETKLI